MNKSKKEHLEDEYNKHLQREGKGAVNENPDGCYWCGSLWHNSQECRSREKRLAYEEGFSHS